MPKLNSATSVFFVLGLGIFVGARLWHLTAGPLNFDEVFSVHAIRHDWRGMIAFIRQDLVHPPLFYVLLKVWARIGGESLLWLRLFPTLIAIISIFPLLLLFKEFNLKDSERNLAVFLIAVNGFLLYYSRSVRMYSLLLFLSLCSLFLFVRFLKSPVISKLVVFALVVTNLLLIYTHYFGWFLIAAESVCLVSMAIGDHTGNLISTGFRRNEGLGLTALWLRNRKLLCLIVSPIVVAIFFSPWIYLVFEVYQERGLSQNLSWAGRPYLDSLIHFYTDLNGPYGHSFSFPWSQRVGLLLFGFPVFIWGCKVLLTWRGQNPQEAKTFWVLFVFAFVPVALVYLASRSIQQSIWLPRGLPFVAVAYLILVAIGMNRLRPQWVCISVIIMVLGWATLAGFDTVRQDEKTRLRVDSWVREMTQLESGSTDSIRIYTLDVDSPYFIWFYLGSKNESRFQIVEVKVPGSHGPPYWLTTNMFPSVAVMELTDLEEDHFWVAFKHQEWQQERTPREIFSEAGYRVGNGFEGGPENKRTHLFPVWR